MTLEEQISPLKQTRQEPPCFHISTSEHFENQHARHGGNGDDNNSFLTPIKLEPFREIGQGLEDVEDVEDFRGF